METRMHARYDERICARIWHENNLSEWSFVCESVLLATLPAQFFKWTQWRSSTLVTHTHSLSLSLSSHRLIYFKMNLIDFRRRIQILIDRPMSSSPSSSHPRKHLWWWVVWWCDGVCVTHWWRLACSLSKSIRHRHTWTPTTFTITCHLLLTFRINKTKLN